MKNDYVLNHDFGYCNENEPRELNKLKLRNTRDVETYVLDIIENAMVSSEGKRVVIIDKNQVEEVQIDLIEKTI